MTATVPPAAIMKILWRMLVVPVTSASAVLGPPIPITSAITPRSGRNPLKDRATFILPDMYQ